MPICCNNFHIGYQIEYNIKTVCEKLNFECKNYYEKYCYINENLCFFKIFSYFTHCARLLT